MRSNRDGPKKLDRDPTMQALIRVYEALRDGAASHILTRDDRLRISVRRPGLECCVLSWTVFLHEFPELWPDDMPEADSDGIPANPRHRAILAALRAGPMKVEVLARAIGLRSSGRLYDGPGNIRGLVALELVELGAEGYALTARGRRVAESMGD